jgi:hypothetical protein
MMQENPRIQIRTPEPQVRVDPNEIQLRVEEAIQNALSQSGTDRSELRNRLEEQIRAAIANAQSQGERITIRPDGQGVTVQRDFDPEAMIPPEAVTISIAFFVMMGFIIVGLPIARAFARRMDRRSAPASASEIAPRLDRIEQGIEAIAIEVERVSEGQRYTTKAIAEIRGLPASNSGWPGDAREAQRVPLGEATRRP